MPIIMHATLPVKPEAREAFLGAIGGLVEASNAEPGVLSYQCYEHVSQPNTFVVVEVYQDKAGMDAHLGSPHFQAAAGGLMQFLAGAPDLTFYEAGDAQTLAL